MGMSLMPDRSRRVFGRIVSLQEGRLGGAHRCGLASSWTDGEYGSCPLDKRIDKRGREVPFDRVVTRLCGVITDL
jgi:hypothetical protein